MKKTEKKNSSIQDNKNKQFNKKISVEMYFGKI